MGRFLKHELSGWKAWEIIWLAAACTIITALFERDGYLVRIFIALYACRN